MEGRHRGSYEDLAIRIWPKTSVRLIWSSKDVQTPITPAMWGQNRNLSSRGCVFHVAVRQVPHLGPISVLVNAHKPKRWQNPMDNEWTWGYLYPLFTQVNLIIFPLLFLFFGLLVVVCLGFFVLVCVCLVSGLLGCFFLLVLNNLCTSLTVFR